MLLKCRLLYIRHSLPSVLSLKLKGEKVETYNLEIKCSAHEQSSIL
jgi:hypothetical protein